MKVKIVKHTPICPVPWWYSKHIGEVFEVYENENMPDLYKTLGNGPGASNIMKCDCERVLPKATESSAITQAQAGGRKEGLDLSHE